MGTTRSQKGSASTASNQMHLMAIKSCQTMSLQFFLEFSSHILDDGANLQELRRLDGIFQTQAQNPKTMSDLTENTNPGKLSAFVREE